MTSSPVTWTEVRVVAPLGWHELITEALASGPCSSAQVIVAGDEEVVTAYLPSSEDHEGMRAEIRAAIAAITTIDPVLADLAATFTPLPPEDYEESWKEHWRPFRVGRRFVVAPPWWDGELKPGELKLELTPGGSFGSGGHATTRMCLRALTERVTGGERILDAGSGSGILTVAAAMLGARSVTAFDVDPTSPDYGEALAQAGGVADRCEWRCGGFEVLGDEDQGFDGLTANIYSDVIQANATELAARLRPGGWFVLSGIPRHHADETRAVVEATGLEVATRERRGKWVSLFGTKPE